MKITYTRQVGEASTAVSYEGDLAELAAAATAAREGQELWKTVFGDDGGTLWDAICGLLGL